MSNVMTGPKAVFRINGTQVGHASSVSFNEAIQLEEVNTLDNLAVTEHAEVGYRVDFTCQNFRVANASVKQLGIMPKFNQILTQGVMTAELIDKVSGAVLLLMEGVKLESRQSQVDARGLMTETWAFKGIKSSDEAGQ